MQNYTGHRFTSEGMVVTSSDGVEVFLDREDVRRLVASIRRELGDFHDKSDDRHPWVPSMKYSKAE